MNQKQANELFADAQNTMNLFASNPQRVINALYTQSIEQLLTLQMTLRNHAMQKKYFKVTLTLEELAESAMVHVWGAYYDELTDTDLGKPHVLAACLMIFIHFLEKGKGTLIVTLSEKSMFVTLNQKRDEIEARNEDSLRSEYKAMKDAFSRVDDRRFQELVDREISMLNLKKNPAHYTIAARLAFRHACREAMKRTEQKLVVSEPSNALDRKLANVRAR